MRFPPLRLLAIGLLGSGLGHAARAQVGDISGPDVEAGRWEVAYDAGFEVNAGHAQSHALGVEHGLNRNWALEAGLETVGAHGQRFEVANVFLEVKRRLTSQDDGAWFSSALAGEYVANLHDAPGAVEFAFAAERNAGRFTQGLNVIVEREFGRDASSDWALESRWFAKLNRDGRFQPAVEWHAAWGTLHHIPHFSRQGHYVGPALYGELGGSETGGEWAYQIAWVFGVAQHTADALLRVQLTWER